MFKRILLISLINILFLISVVQAAPLPGCPDCPDWCTVSEPGIIQCQPDTNAIDDIWYTSFTHRSYNNDLLYAGVAWSGSTNPAEWWSPPHLRNLYVKLNDISGLPDSAGNIYLRLYYDGRYQGWATHPTRGLTVARITSNWNDNTVTSPSATAIYNKGEGLINNPNNYLDVDITDLYESWQEGDYPNYGVALLNPGNYGWCYAYDCSDNYYSSESTNPNKPMFIFTAPQSEPELYLEGLPDQYLHANSGLNQELIDLWDYTTFEGDIEDLEYWVNDQTNTSVVNCFVEDNRHMSCAVQPGIEGNSDVAVTVIDPNTGISATDTLIVYVDGLDDELNITSLECFEHVIVNHDQSCSVYVEYDAQPIGDVNIDIYYDDGTLFGSCTTDDISGGCEVQDLQTSTGSRTVYAIAELEGYPYDDDMNPTFDYEVLDERYDIINLKVYNDPNFTQEDYDFFRGEPLYVAFQVTDMWDNNQLVDDGVITEADLVSPPGGRVELQNIAGLGQQYWFYYTLNPIPPTHDFLGLSQIFTFAFNFEDCSGGEEEVNLIIRNNPPQIGNIPNIETNITYELDLSQYESDVEDSGNDLIWSVSDVNTNLFSAAINGKTLRIVPNNIGEDQITLTLTDLDGDSDNQSVNVKILGKGQEEPETPEEPRLMNQDLSILGLRVTSDEYLLPGDVLELITYAENNAEEDLEDLKIAVVLQELGESRRNGPFDLKAGKGVSKRIFLDIPEDTAPGTYSIRITISNDKIRRVKYRDFIII